MEKKTHQTHPSLAQLRMTLTSAVSEAPASLTVDEQHAMDLIHRMKTDYNKPLPFSSWKDDSVLNTFDLQKVIGSYV